MTSKSKSNSKLPWDWKAHMFGYNDDWSDDDEVEMYDYSFDNHVTDDENDDNVSEGGKRGGGREGGEASTVHTSSLRSVQLQSPPEDTGGSPAGHGVQSPTESRQQQQQQQQQQRQQQQKQASCDTGGVSLSVPGDSPAGRQPSPQHHAAMDARSYSPSSGSPRAGLSPQARRDRRDHSPGITGSQSPVAAAAGVTRGESGSGSPRTAPLTMPRRMGLQQEEGDLDQPGGHLSESSSSVFFLGTSPSSASSGVRVIGGSPRGPNVQTLLGTSCPRPRSSGPFLGRHASEPQFNLHTTHTHPLTHGTAPSSGCSTASTSQARQVFRQLSVQNLRLGSEPGNRALYLPEPGGDSDGDGDSDDQDQDAAAAAAGEATSRAEKSTKGSMSWVRLMSLLGGGGRKSKDSPQHQQQQQHAVNPGTGGTQSQLDSDRVKAKKATSLWGRTFARAKLTTISEGMNPRAPDIADDDDRHSDSLEGDQRGSRRDSRRTEPSPIPLIRQRPGSTSTTTTTLTNPSHLSHPSPESCEPPLPSSTSTATLSRSPPSPLVPEMVLGPFAAYGDVDDDALLSDTSSVASDSLDSVESGEGVVIGGGRGGDGKRPVGGSIKVGSAQDEITEIPEAVGSSKGVVERLQKDNGRGGSSVGSTPSSSSQHSLDGPYGRLFTAKFFKRLGRKGLLRNVSHVSHVHRGTLLVTDMLAAQLVHMSLSGRVIRCFQVEQGSEPWCACVTPRGHLAVTLRRPACVTVWSGNGTLVSEFGHGLLQLPTGLACDRQGRFLVADEKTNRVAFFSPDGTFLRYLSEAASSKESAGRVVINQSTTTTTTSTTTTSSSSSTDDKENTVSTEDKGPDSRLQKKRVRIMLDVGEEINNAAADLAVDKKGSSLSSSLPRVEDDAVVAPEKATWKEEGGRRSLILPDYAFSVPRYVCVSPSGHIVVSDSGSNSVKVFSPEGVFLRSMGGSGSKDGQLKVPYGVCCDQDSNVYVADHYNDRVSVFSLQGQFLQQALTAVSGLCRPRSLAVRPARVKTLFVAHGGLRSTEVLVHRLESTPCYISFTCDL